MIIGHLIFASFLISLFGLFYITLVGRRKELTLAQLLDIGLFISKDPGKYLNKSYIRAFNIARIVYIVSLLSWITYMGFNDVIYLASE